MSNTVNDAITAMAREISARLRGDAPSIYVYGSVALNDYRHGWSDIDILCLTPAPLTNEQAQSLLNLRDMPGEYFRKFEGGITDICSYRNRAPGVAVYWGTSGERITNNFALDPFSARVLMKRGMLISGADARDKLPTPGYAELRRAVKRHCETIRAHARETSPSLYSHGWLLDISRCLYTLETGDVIAKTLAGEWALARELCPNPEKLARAIYLRYHPEDFDAAEAAALGEAVQSYADILESALAIKPEIATEADIPEWLTLAASLAEYFPGLDLPDYAKTLGRNIARGSALRVRIRGELAGVLLYSPKQMTLSCMAVKPEYRGLGAAKALINEMLDKMPAGDISVTTYRDNDPRAAAPRALYASFGFAPAEEITEFDYPMQKFILKSGRRTQ